MLDALDASQRARALTHCVGALRQQARVGAVDAQLLGDLRSAWGNESFSVDNSFLSEVVARALVSRGAVLDCGSGLSTIVAGVIADVRGGGVWSLEQDKAWYKHVSGTLKQLGLTQVNLWYAPLRQYDDFVWFDVDGRTLPREFTHVFCDGPAVFPSDWSGPLYANWRVGVVPVLQGLGIPFGEIILDDAEDGRCSRVRERWAELGVATEVVSTPTGSFVIGRPDKN